MSGPEAIDELIAPTQGDKRIAELGTLPDHEGVVIVEAEFLPELREVLTLDHSYVLHRRR